LLACALGASWFLIQPMGSLRITTNQDRLYLMVYMLVSVAILALVLHQRNIESCLRGALDSLDGMNRELQAAKESAESANRIKDQFLNSLSHELRNPIDTLALSSYESRPACRAGRP
jgi:signal transduction histidine kinase